MGAIYLIRHGQASFGKADYDNLSKTGLKQPVVLGESLKSRVPQLDAVQIGSMKRHRQTAEGCLQGMDNNTGWVINAGWNEYDHEQVIERYKPAYKNKVLMKADLAKTLNPRREFQKMFAAAIERWLSNEYSDEYTETWQQFQARVLKALNDLRESLGPSKTAFVFTSGGPISAVAQHLLHISDDDIFKLNWTLANCGITKIIYSDRGMYLSSLNEHSAFEGAHQNLITYR